MMLPRSPRPRSVPSLTTLSAPPGCTKTSTPSCSALAQNGSYFAVEAPRRRHGRRSRRLACPVLLTASSSCSTARSGCCSATDARPDEAIRVGRAPLRQLLVLNGDDSPRQLAIRAVPPSALVAQDLDVDAPFIQRAKASRTEHEGSVQVVADVAGQVRVADDVQLRRLDEVAVNVDDLDPASPDGHFASRRLSEHVRART